MTTTTETRPPLALIVQGREPVQVVAYACGTCGIVTRTEHEAVGHCEPYDCSGGCGAKLPKKEYRTKCDACMEAARQAGEDARYEKARKVPLAEYQQEGLFVEDEWFNDWEDLVDSMDSQGREVPEWAWGCEPLAFALDAERLLENALDEHHEDARDGIDDAEVKRLQAFLDEWAAAQKITSYQCDTSTVVLLPRAEEVADG